MDFERKKIIAKPFFMKILKINTKTQIVFSEQKLYRTKKNWRNQITFRTIHIKCRQKLIMFCVLRCDNKFMTLTGFQRKKSEMRLKSESE